MIPPQEYVQSAHVVESVMGPQLQYLALLMSIHLLVQAFVLGAPLANP